MKKLSVIIADDDRLVVKDLCHMIDWEKLGFKIAATAPSGEKALELVRQHQPFLLITDVVMLGMNGLDLIEQAHKECPQMKFLVISSYDNFHYLKRAMASDVIDYLLKTEITPGTLTEKLLQAKAEYSDESGDLTKLTSQSLERYFLQPGSEMIADYEDRYPIRDKKYYFFCFTLGHMFTKEYMEHIARITAELRAVSDWTYQLALDFCAYPIIFMYKDYMIAGLSDDMHGIQTSNVGWAIHNFSYKSAKQMNALRYPTVQFYTTRAFRISEFRHYFFDHLPLMTYHHFFYPSQPVDLDSLLPEKYLPEKTAFHFRSLVLDSDHEEEDILQLKNYMETCAEHYDLTRLLEFHMDFCTHINISTNGQSNFDVYLNAPTLAHLEKWIFNTLHDAISLLDRGMDYEYSPVIDSTIKFMMQNYQKHDLSAAEIADAVSLSPNWLGVMFKKETGKTVNEYLSQIRLEKAIELLEKTNLKIYEIADKCGFASSQYFSTVIFQKTGRKPIEYRKGRK